VNLRIRSYCRTGACSSRCSMRPPNHQFAHKESAVLEWQTAISELMLAVERNRPTILARIGFMQELNRHRVRECNPNRKDLIGAGAS
jgi:hypothetical protein